MTTQSHDEPPLGAEDRVGDHLRRWRTRLGWSQMRVALDCNVSTRHLSFVETGRSRPSRELIIHLARSLDATNRELNVCLLAAGYAPQHVMELDAEREALVATLVTLIDRHDPYPAFVFNSDWVMERINAGGQWLCSLLMPIVWAGVLDPSVGVDMIDTLIDPDGLFLRMRNAAEVGSAVLRQLRLEQLTNAELEERADQLEMSLLQRFPDYFSCRSRRTDPSLHLEFSTACGPLSFFTLQSVVGIPQQITAATPRVELWFPANSRTRKVMERREVSES